jgi:serine/threonine protein kinase
MFVSCQKTAQFIFTKRGTLPLCEEIDEAAQISGVLMKPGETFAHGKYTLLRKLRSSGMAEVWLARQHGTEGFAKDVVIKRILPHLAEDDKLVTMFLDEARIAANLNHANVVHIFDLGNDGENYFIAMEYIRGYDIEQICEQLKSRNTPFPIEYAVRIIADTCLGLGYAHDCTTADGTPMGVVHRDVSPQNILVSHTGVVKLIDFGIAKARTSSSRTQVGHTKGKICYMSPEQMMARELDRRSDLFSTAVVLYEMLCATKPFDGDNLLACFHKLMKEGIPSPRELRYDIPPRLEAILMKGLAKDREERYPTAAAFRYEMEGFLREMGISVGPEHLADFLKWLFTPPESTQVVLDLPRVSPVHPNVAYPSPSAPMISTQDRISAVPRPVTKPNLPTGHNFTPPRAKTGSGFGIGAAEVTVMDDLVRQEPHFGFEPTDINPNIAHHPSLQSNYSSPQVPSMAVSRHHTGPDLGLPMELEEEDNPYARRRRDAGGGGGVWIWALFGFVLLTSGAVAAHFMGWLPGSLPKENPPSPPPTIRAISNPSDAGAALPTPPPPTPPLPNTTRPEDPRTQPPSTPPAIERRTEPVRPRPPVRTAKRPTPRPVARNNGCPRGGRGKLILDTPEKGQAYPAADPTDSFEVPNLSEAKSLPAGRHPIVFIWGNNKRWKTSVCVYRGKVTQYTCEMKRYCRVSRE